MHDKISEIQNRVDACVARISAVAAQRIFRGQPHAPDQWNKYNANHAPLGHLGGRLHLGSIAALYTHSTANPESGVAVEITEQSGPKTVREYSATLLGNGAAILSVDGVAIDFNVFRNKATRPYLELGIVAMTLNTLSLIGFPIRSPSGIANTRRELLIYGADPFYEGDIYSSGVHHLVNTRRSTLLGAAARFHRQQRV